MEFDHAKIVGISFFPFLFPPSKCSLQTREYSLTGVLTLLMLISHLVNYVKANDKMTVLALLNCLCSVGQCNGVAFFLQKNTNQIINILKPTGITVKYEIQSIPLNARRTVNPSWRFMIAKQYLKVFQNITLSFTMSLV